MKIGKYFVFEWNKPLCVDGKYFSYRWRLDFYLFSFRVHKWLCSDDKRAYHSHPNNIISFILKGRYFDHRLVNDTQKRITHINRFNFNFIKRNTKH